MRNIPTSRKQEKPSMGSKPNASWPSRWLLDYSIKTQWFQDSSFCLLIIWYLPLLHFYFPPPSFSIPLALPPHVRLLESLAKAQINRHWGICFKRSTQRLVAPIMESGLRTSHQCEWVHQRCQFRQKKLFGKLLLLIDWLISGCASVWETHHHLWCRCDTHNRRFVSTQRRCCCCFTRL